MSGITRLIKQAEFQALKYPQFAQFVGIYYQIFLRFVHDYEYINSEQEKILLMCHQARIVQTN